MKAQSLTAAGTVAMVAALVGTVALAFDSATIDQQVPVTLTQFYKLVPDRNQYLAQHALSLIHI